MKFNTPPLLFSIVSRLTSRCPILAFFTRASCIFPFPFIGLRSWPFVPHVYLAYLFLFFAALDPGRC